MNLYNGYNKKKSYFEGWYFKHQKNDNMIAFIPSVNFDKYGNKTAIIQVITNSFSSYAEYSFKEFCIKSDKIKIGKNEFSERGISIDIQTKQLNISGSVVYENLTPIKYDIMGPFRHLPMQCNHGIISLHHYLHGNIKVNNSWIELNGGTGYIEKDYGSSFPCSYTWLQCNTFKNKISCVMVSIADIPFFGGHFKGCIGIVFFNFKEYRFATYNGVRIIRCNENKIILKQQDFYFEIDIFEKSGHPLLAPVSGKMARKICENNNCTARFRFYNQGNLLFDETSENVGFEYSQSSKKQISAKNN